MALTALTPESRSSGSKPCQVEDVRRPFVLTTASHIDELRADSRPGARRFDLYSRSQKKNADRWLLRDIQIPERSGHFHDFVCTDGTRLQEPPNQTIPDVIKSQTFACPACGSIYSGPKIDGAMRQRYHTWLIAAARDLALVGAVENDDRYYSKAAEILLKYADAYPGRHTTATTGGIFYQSLDESVNFISLAQAYDLLYETGALTAATKNHIEQDLLWECAEGLIQCGIGGNWGSWHLSAVGVIGLATKHQRYIDYGVNSFKSQMWDQLGEDGLWPESVHTYHFYPMRGFVLLAEACANAGIDLYSYEAKPGKGLRAMFHQPLSYMYPNFQLPAINDGWFKSTLPLDMYEVGYERYRTPELAWAVKEMRARYKASEISNVDAIDAWTLLHHAELPSEVAAPRFKSIDFWNIGIVVLRAGAPGSETILTFDYGRHFSHGQRDKMGITLFAKGSILAADYGTPSYGSSIMPYYTGTTSHNTVMIDGKDQPVTKAGKLLAFKDTPLIKVAASETTEIASGVTWRRTVLLTDQYAATIDQLVSEGEHQYDQFFHCEGAGLASDSLPTPFRKPPNHLRYVAEMRQASEPGESFQAFYMDPLKNTGVRLGSVPLLNYGAAYSSGTEVVTGRIPAESGRRTVPVIILRKRGKAAAFANVLRTPHTGEWPESRTKEINDPLPIAIAKTCPIWKSVDKLEIMAEKNITDTLDLKHDYLKFVRNLPDGKTKEVLVKYDLQTK